MKKYILLLFICGVIISCSGPNPAFEEMSDYKIGKLLEADLLKGENYYDLSAKYKEEYFDGYEVRNTCYSLIREKYYSGTSCLNIMLHEFPESFFYEDHYIAPPCTDPTDIFDPCYNTYEEYALRSFVTAEIQGLINSGYSRSGLLNTGYSSSLLDELDSDLTW